MLELDIIESNVTNYYYYIILLLFTRDKNVAKKHILNNSYDINDINDIKIYKSEIIKADKYNITTNNNSYVMINYLLSKISQHNISLHFNNLYYIEKIKKELKVKIEYHNNNITIGDLIDINSFKTFMFQTCAAIICSYNEFKVKHNCLKLINITYSNTDKNYIIYNYKKNFYKININNKIIKINNYNYGTYDLPGIKGYNQAAENIYTFNKINKESFLPEDCPYSDVSLIAHNLLYLITKNYSYNDIPGEIIQFLNKFLIVKNNKKKINIYKEDETSKIINSTVAFNKNYIIDFDFYNCFIIDSNLIDFENETIYYI